MADSTVSYLSDLPHKMDLLARLKIYFEGVLDSAITLDTAYQAIYIGFALAIAFIASRPTTNKLKTYIETHSYSIIWVAPLLRAVLKSVFPIFILAFLIVGYGFFSLQPGLNLGLFDVATNLVIAWLVIRFLLSFMEKSRLSRGLALFIWALVALNIIGILDIILVQLDGIALNLGQARLSILSLLKGIISFSIFMWVATVISNMAEKKIQTFYEITPSLRVLLGKTFRISLFAIAFFVGLGALGVDLSVFAIFSGAVGVGVGFGLQKVVSNFISGIILLIDRSIKPGDVIVIDDTYGWVNSLSGRYVSIITRDGKEHLIPNEQLITEKVENWSYSNKNVRLKLPVGISYGSDLDKAKDLMEGSTKDMERVLEDPAPKVIIKGFGDNSVDLELRIWIKDPANGVSNIRSDVYHRIWTLFHENGVEFPYPQRDLHLKTVSDEAAKAMRS